MSVTGWAQPSLREPIGGVRHRRADARLPVAAARMAGFLALAAFGAATWARMVDPAATLATVVTLLAALAAGCDPDRRRPTRARARCGARS